MEQFPQENKTSSSEKKIVTITENDEFFIIDTGTKTRYVPRWKAIMVEGASIRAEKLVQALALYPDDEPAEALEKMKKEHPEIK